MAVEFDFDMNLYPSDEKAWLELYKYARSVAENYKVAVITLTENPKIICGNDMVDVVGCAWEKYGYCSLFIVKNTESFGNLLITRSEGGEGDV